MALEKKFVKEGIRNMEVEEFFSKEFSRSGYSHCEIQRTPLSIRITVFANKPGMIIGRGGKNIDIITNILKERFGFENPQLDVQEVNNSEIDPLIIAKWIANSIERGINFKRVVHQAIERVMSSGAAGIAIRMGGKLGSDISRVEKFSSGYIKYSGNDADTLVKKAYAHAIVKLGMIGIQVRILPDRPEELDLLKRAERPVVEEKILEEVEEMEEEEIEELEKAAEEVKEVKAAKSEKKEEKISEENGNNKEETAKADESS
ncbi:MAG: 30S ribosomal protein S3 [Candidatus Aenigmatarchaeota archaeon]